MGRRVGLGWFGQASSSMPTVTSMMANGRRTSKTDEVGGGGGGLLPYIDAAGRGGVALLKGWKEWICGNGRGGQGGGALAVVVRETSDGREWRCRRGRLGPG